MSPLLVGVLLGAAGAFFLDPQQGRRRRALARDKMVRGWREGHRLADTTSRRLRNRAQGLIAEARSLRHADLPDRVLVERVRAELGRHCSHPRAIEVTAHEGRVVLTGAILAAEQDGVFEAVRAVRGVHHVENQLRAYRTPEGISSLQGG